ncbi:hypothetical protein GGS24DRAFT_397588 [Hypoxylon argillaceum]|nr:hypothetical protein GGS24DRAFT_397588 [Hypoxylon argillaceum]KAI1149613.1 hypothetical protein F4825DRAFT_453296 [Nemania diffusa]
MSSNNVMKWNEKVHEDVLIAVNVSQLPRADWDRIMASLRDMGYTFTESALRQHLQKLKKKDASAPSTPAKPAGAAKQKKPTGSTGKKRTHQVAADVDVDVDEDEYDKPDVKKLKVKMEPLGYDPVHLDDDDDDGEV